MKAAVLKAFGSPLVVETVPDPILGTGEVIVDIVATGVVGYAAEVLDGTRQYLLELPSVLGFGGIGRVRQPVRIRRALCKEIGSGAIRRSAHATTW